MPGQRSLVRMAAVGIALLVEIGETIEFRVTVRVILVHDVDLHFAEPACKSHLTARGEILGAEQQHLVVEESPIDRVEQGIVYLAAQIDTDQFRPESRRQAAHFESILARGRVFWHRWRQDSRDSWKCEFYPETARQCEAR